MQCNHCGASAKQRLCGKCQSILKNAPSIVNTLRDMISVTPTELAALVDSELKA